MCKNQKSERSFNEEFIEDECFFEEVPDVGKYRYIRSSKRREAMVTSENAEFDPVGKRWFEQTGCGYTSICDGEYQQEADECEFIRFVVENPGIEFRESFYDINYGETRGSVAYAFFFLMEYNLGESRIFHFRLRNVTMSEVQEYIDALKNWHISGTYNVGEYEGVPNYENY